MALVTLIKYRQDHLNNLKDEFASKLPQSTFQKLGDIIDCCYANQDFFNEVVYYQEEGGIHGLTKAPVHSLLNNSKNVNTTPIRFDQQHRNQAVIHSLYREWSEEGSEERNQAFQPILQELTNLLPVNMNNISRMRVLVPGCGLGRLPLEIAALGIELWS
jgi:carnosine N-methyltransferase